MNGGAQEKIRIHPNNHIPATSQTKKSCKYLNISAAMFLILPRAVSPGIPGFFCRRVLIVSIGALERGPMAPDTRPMRVV